MAAVALAKVIPAPPPDRPNGESVTTGVSNAIRLSMLYTVHSQVDYLGAYLIYFVAFINI